MFLTDWAEKFMKGSHGYIALNTVLGMVIIKSDHLLRAYYVPDTILKPLHKHYLN